MGRAQQAAAAGIPPPPGLPPPPPPFRRVRIPPDLSLGRLRNFFSCCRAAAPPAALCRQSTSLSGMLLPPPTAAPADIASARHCRQRTRLAEALLAAPSRTDRYFDDHPGRRWLWLAISFAAGAPCCGRTQLTHAVHASGRSFRIARIPPRRFMGAATIVVSPQLCRSATYAWHCAPAGFYCANTVSLSFGTLAVNDVVAAAVTVGFCEVWSCFESDGRTLL